MSNTEKPVVPERWNNPRIEHIRKVNAAKRWGHPRQRSKPMR